MKDIKLVIQELISSISSYDSLEKGDIDFACSWISSGAPIFRLDGAAYPDPHLIVYFVVLDLDQQKILLTDHKKAQLWIPTGGHVEVNEHPMQTVKREVKEELGLEAHFLYDKPFFLTVTPTGRMNIRHTDVTLWYLLKGNSLNPPTYYDPEEFNAVRWFGFDEAIHLNGDPHIHRFLKKLEINKTTLSRKPTRIAENPDFQDRGLLC